MYKEVN